MGREIQGGVIVWAHHYSMKDWLSFMGLRRDSDGCDDEKILDQHHIRSRRDKASVINVSQEIFQL
jgi:hypothetical protein